jgi:hypothetical protein
MFTEQLCAALCQKMAVGASFFRRYAIATAVTASFDTLNYTYRIQFNFNQFTLTTAWWETAHTGVPLSNPRTPRTRLEEPPKDIPDSETGNHQLAFSPQLVVVDDWHLDKE